MSNEYEQERQSKANSLRDLGVDPYANHRQDVMPIAEARVLAMNEEGRRSMAEFGGREVPKPSIITVAGRIVLKRDMGNLNFVTIRQDGEEIQVAVGFKVLPPETKTLYKNHLDIGDIIYATGELRPTKTGEYTVWATELVLGAKAISPPPSKVEGLVDVELRYRNRHVDLWSNPAVMDTMRKRSLIIKLIREYMDQHGFIEVETPAMQPKLGGANAKPFITHHSKLDMDLFLRVAPELYLKRLLVGGMGKVFEIGKNFRNEGISPRHNPEFTAIEAYQSYGNYETMMTLIEGMLRYVVAKTEVEPSTPMGDGNIPRIRFEELLQRHGYAGGNAGRLLSEEDSIKVFENEIQPTLIAPTFVTHFPSSHVPLCKPSPNDPRWAEGFELIINGMEVAPGYTELNDPYQQVVNFAKQKGEDAVEMDADFIEALKCGMPPAGGMGIGLDRLVMLLTNQQSVRDVILFPLQRPKE